MPLSETQETGVVVVSGFVLLAFLAMAVRQVTGAIVLGVFAYYATRPIYRRLKQYTQWDSIAAGSALVVFFTPLTLFILYGLLTGIRELRILAIRYNDTMIDTVVNRFFDVPLPSYSQTELLQVIASGDRALMVDIAQSLFASAGILTHIFITLFLASVIAFYGLRDGYRLRTWVVSLFRNTEMIETYFRKVDRDLRYVFFGNLLNAVVAGTLAVIVYQTMNTFTSSVFTIPYPFLLGALTGLASLIPVIGMKLVYTPLVVYLYAKGATTEPATFAAPTVFTLVVISLVDGVPDLFLRPYITGRDIHVGLLIGAYVVGPILFGWYGLFLGPILLVLIIHFTGDVLPELFPDPNRL